MTDHTGYDPQDDDDAPSPFQLWRVEPYRAEYSHGFHAHVVCNGQARGLIRFDSKEELEWFQNLVGSAERRLTDEELENR